VLHRTREIAAGFERYQVVGGLLLSADARNGEVFRSHVSILESWGVTNSQALEGLEVERRWPGVVGSEVGGALYCSEDGMIRSLGLTVSLADRARRAGAVIFEGCDVERLATKGARVVGVQVAGDLQRSDIVVLAAGGWSSGLLGDLRVRLPLRRFTLSVASLVGAPKGLPFISQVDDRWYLIERAPGNSLLGLPPASDEDLQPPSAERVAGFLGLLRRRLRGFDAARHAGGWTGLLCGTPDGRPLLGPHPDVKGLHLATGFAGGGVQWVAAGEAVAEMALELTPTLDIPDFLAARYAAWDGRDFEFDERGPYFYDEAVPVS
ncbi:MAG TPA: FAD-dependent oxidoreductase, partial [Candidatus Dormibacteraeota bacterium]|nr:FAD-dependent oxidoreductase [Candidatus Dormibacteraeota bacterium]